MKEGLQDLAKVAEHIKEAFTQSCGAPAPLPALPLPFRGSHTVVTGRADEFDAGGAAMDEVL